MTEFARRLRTLRAAAGISQGAIARTLNLDHSFVSRLESGTRQPSRDVAAQFSNLLDSGSPTLLIAAGYLPEWMLEELEREIDRLQDELDRCRANPGQGEEATHE